MGREECGLKYAGGLLGLDTCLDELQGVNELEGREQGWIDQEINY